MADKTAKLVTDQLCQLNTIDGNFNSVGMWKVKKKVLPRPTDPPMAKKDSGGNLVTAPLLLKKLYLETYKKRLEHRPMKKEYEDIFQLKTLLWNLRYDFVKDIKSPPWDMNDLEKAIKVAEGVKFQSAQIFFGT